MSDRNRRCPWLLVLGLALAVSGPLGGQTIDIAMPQGENYDQAEFRLWYPEEVERLRGLFVLVPGSNADGRGWTTDSFWRELARRHEFGLVGVRFTDKPHEHMAIEQYADVSRGSGQALLDALAEFAGASNHAEVATAPVLLWGMSAGGQFNYEFTVWKPERVIGFVVNKGGVYYNAMASEATRQVPGLFFIGEDDLAYRNDIIQGVYSVNRRFRAKWALAVEPGVAHEYGRSRELAALFYEELIALRLPPETAAANEKSRLRPLEYEEGFLGDPKSSTYSQAAGAVPTSYPTAWLPTERLARAWQAVVTGLPFYLLDVDLEPLIAAYADLWKGERLAGAGKISEAIDAYRNARERDSRLTITAGTWNQLCWYGGLWDRAADVLFACERAIELTPNHGGRRDSRGLVRALLGDTEGAIEDFEFFVKSTEDERARERREVWIEALRVGTNPFTPEVLAELRGF